VYDVRSVAVSINTTFETTLEMRYEGATIRCQIGSPWHGFYHSIKFSSDGVRGAMTDHDPEILAVSRRSVFELIRSAYVGQRLGRYTWLDGSKPNRSWKPEMNRLLGKLAWICTASCIVALATGANAADELSEAKFQSLHAQLSPAADEPWRTIPWKIAVLDAQHAAAAENKPIFIWAMDGHPLGCT
jgi:hypothetical protein